MLKRKNGGFTLVEIMIVVAIIALLAAIAVPGFLRARKRSQGTTIKNDLRLIDAAKDQYAIEYNKTTESPSWDDLTPYFKPGTRLQQGNSDLFGRTYTINSLNSLPGVNGTSFTGLSDVCDNAFWSPYPTS
jgi:prepilin-type N-terminal cleavage/methylation domain-containing protein